MSKDKCSSIFPRQIKANVYVYVGFRVFSPSYVRKKFLKLIATLPQLEPFYFFVGWRKQHRHCTILFADASTSRIIRELSELNRVLTYFLLLLLCPILVFVVQTTHACIVEKSNFRNFWWLNDLCSNVLRYISEEIQIIRAKAKFADCSLLSRFLINLLQIWTSLDHVNSYSYIFVHWIHYLNCIDVKF